MHAGRRLAVDALAQYIEIYIHMALYIRIYIHMALYIRIGIVTHIAACAAACL
jgi:hypothetical protein